MTLHTMTPAQLIELTQLGFDTMDARLLKAIAAEQLRRDELAKKIERYEARDVWGLTYLR